MGYEQPHIPNQEQQELSRTPRFSVNRILSKLGFGEGTISGAPDDPEVLSVLDETIHTSPDIIVPVQTDDDGCSDGRGTIEIYDKDNSYTDNLNRPKVFGGAVAMNSAIDIGLGRAEGKSLQTVFDNSTEELKEKGMNYGAHTDEHAHGPNCGCGAIDKSPEAIVAAVKYEANIRNAISALGIETQGLDEVFDNFRKFAESEQSGLKEYSGSKVMDRILAAGKTIKRLGGQHKERRIILNAVRGYTVNQNLVRQATNGEAQVFAIDIWRLEDIALSASSDQAEQQNAFLSELVYTLGTAAVLTKGDLPIYLIQPE